jgi:hypothetical protein
MAKVSIISQILEADRELQMRRQVYARRVASRDMRQSEADLLIGRMEAIRQTLVFCQHNEADIRAFIAAKIASKDAPAIASNNSSPDQDCVHS